MTGMILNVVLVILVVLILGYAVRSLWKKHKNGGGCSCGCDSCDCGCSSKED